MIPQKFHVYTADLNPRFGTEPGKIRPVVVIQTNLLNEDHPSTIICPITTKVHPEAKILRIHLKKFHVFLLLRFLLAPVFPSAIFLSFQNFKPDWR